MKRSNRLVILVGVLLAVLAFVAIVILLNQRDGSGGDAASRPTETVLVAAQDIAIGDPVTPDVVREVQIDPEAVQQDAAPERDPGRAASPHCFAIPEGAQVTAEAIGLGERRRTSTSPRMLEPGEKAITFQVDRVTGIDFLVTPGDTIDIVLSQQISVLQETADSAANTDPDAPPRFETVTGLENQRSGQGHPPGQAGALRQLDARHRAGADRGHERGRRHRRERRAARAGGRRTA